MVMLAVKSSNHYKNYACSVLQVSTSVFQLRAPSNSGFHISWPLTAIDLSGLQKGYAMDRQDHGKLIFFKKINFQTTFKTKTFCILFATSALGEYR